MAKRLICLITLTILLISSSYAQESENASDAVNTATLKVQNVVVEEGSEFARIPITISSENPGQTIGGLAMTVHCGSEGDPVTIVEHDKAFDESVWNAHPKILQMVQNFGPSSAMFIAMPWQEPWGEIEADGVVAIITVSIEGLKVNAEYPIMTDWQGKTSATATMDGMLYYPIRLTHESGKLKIVPKRDNNLN